MRMARLHNASLFAVGSLVTLTAVQAASSSASVTSIFFPLADQQPLLGTIIGGNSDAHTIVVQCDPSADSNECGFPTSITITAGPSTVHYQPTGIYNAIGELDCRITGTTEAVCALTAGPYDSASLETATDFDFATPAPSSSTTTATATGTDLSDAWIVVTITAGEVQSSVSSASTASSSMHATTSSSSIRTSPVSGISNGDASQAISGSPARPTSNNAARLLSGLTAGLVIVPVLLL